MKVSELIEQLKTMPQEAELGYAWDGEVRSIVRHVWLARSGIVVFSDGDVIYSTESRPSDAPTGGTWRPK